MPKGTSLTRLSKAHVDIFHKMLSKEDQRFFHSIVDSRQSEGMGIATSHRDAWMVMKKRKPEICEEIEVTYFDNRAGRPLRVDSDQMIVSLGRDRVVKHEAARDRAMSLEERLNLSRSVGVVGGSDPLPDSILDRHGKPVENLVDGDGVGWPTGGRVNFRQTVEFVAEHLCRSDVDPTRVPSGTAWGLLSWARRGNETNFFNNIFKALVPTQSKIQADDDRLTSETVDYEHCVDMLNRAMVVEGVDDVAVAQLQEEDDIVDGFEPSAGDWDP